MGTSEVNSRNIAISMRKSVENLVISSHDAIGQSISQALTFSGVIAQHGNQLGQDNKSVSRSPSPSLRNNESGSGDNVENEKTSEASSGESAPPHTPEVIPLPNVTPSPANNKSDNPKAVPSNTTPRSESIGGGGVGGVGRTKKKSWYNALYPTYKSKSDDFKRLFKDLPDDERLIVDYSCALQKDILAHGRLYASQNYLCFYASIFGWETSMSLRWKDVTAITKEKTALVIPNAILVCTEGEKNFLTSFSGRDKAYLMLFRIWQNALMDQPMSSQEIWQWVHTCYGEELGFNSDDEGYARDAIEDVSSLPSAVIDTTAEEVVDSSSMDAGGGAGEAHTSGDAVHPLDACSQIVANGDGETSRDDAGDALPTDMSDTTESEPDKQPDDGEDEQCTCNHEGKLFLRQRVPFNVDELFTMIFTNSRFNLELLAARGTTDYVQAPWQPQGGLKVRQVSYTLGLTAGPIGPKEVHVTETQVMNKCSKPGLLYSIDSTSENSGIPYADYFTVEAHYCLRRATESATDFALYGHVKYKKSMWPMVKAFLEKNTMSGLEEFSRVLEARLAVEADTAAPAKRLRRRRRPPPAVSSPEISPLTAVKSPTSTILAPRASVARAAASSSGGRWLTLALITLLVINAILYWRLYHADSHYALDFEHLHNRLSSQTAEWSQLLERHSVRQRSQLLAWRDALDRAVAHLAQTEQALSKLLETIKPALEKAQAEETHSEL